MSACPLESPADPGAHDKPHAPGMDGLQPPAEPTREGADMGGDCEGMHPRGGAESELYQRPRGGSSSLRRATSVIFRGLTISSTWSGERLSPGDSYNCPKVDVGGGAVPGTKGRGPQEPPKQSQRWAFRRGRGPWPKGIWAYSLPADAEEAEVGVSIWIVGPSGWVQRLVKDLDEVQTAVQSIWGLGVADYWLVVEGRSWGGAGSLLEGGMHVQVRLRGVGGAGEGGVDQQNNGGGEMPTAERMMEMMRLRGEQMKLLAASTVGLREEVEELRRGAAVKNKGGEPKEEEIPPLTTSAVKSLEQSPHLPRWMAGQCKLLRELLESLERDVEEEERGMEGVEEGGEGGDGGMVITDPEDGGTPWDWFAWGIWVEMVKNQREYGAKWGNSKRKGEAAAGRSGGASSSGGGGSVAPITQPGFIGGWRWRCTKGN